jgi:hypothetical protein
MKEFMFHLTDMRAWKALERHYRQIEDIHMRDFFLFWVSAHIHLNPLS